jgi:hypothetical protein
MLKCLICFERESETTGEVLPVAIDCLGITEVTNTQRRPSNISKNKAYFFGLRFLPTMMALPDHNIAYLFLKQN